MYQAASLFSPEEAGHYNGAPNSPAGSMTNLTLDRTHQNLGIHEHFDYSLLYQGRQRH